MKRLLAWAAPGFVLWIVANAIHATIYTEALRDGKFPSDGDSIAIPLVGLALVTAVGLIFVTGFVFLITWLARKFFPHRAPWIIGAAFVLLLVPFLLQYRKFSHLRNAQFVAQDLGIEIAPDVETEVFSMPFSLSLDNFTCSELVPPKDVFFAIVLKVAGDPAWTSVPSPDPIEPDWKKCLPPRGEGYRYYQRTESPGQHRIRVVVGVNQATGHVIHAYADRLESSVR